MAMNKSEFVCDSCGASYPRWSGQCHKCEQWNTLVEKVKDVPVKSGAFASQSQKFPAAELFTLSEFTKPINRLPSNIAELDRVLGGGFVAGSLVLLSGDPGIGKSTLTLQASASMAKTCPVFYVSAEEAAEQVVIRAKRLGLSSSSVKLISSTSLGSIMATLEEQAELGLAIIDSIQAIRDDRIDSIAGSVTQIKHCTQVLADFARRKNCVVVIVGHVTKDGQISGPKLLEHAVDVVLLFEGENQYSVRILRSSKNRFGNVSELGVFSMSQSGLVEASNPALLSLGKSRQPSSGVSVAVTLEGGRAMMLEVQALVGASNSASPRRNVVGWDNARCAMLLAVMDAHCNTDFAGRDVYVAVSGGFRIIEPGADLAIAAALISSLRRIVIPADTVFFGEISLSGNLRAVPGIEIRIEEARRGNFNNVVLPNSEQDSKDTKQPSEIQNKFMSRVPIAKINQLLNMVENSCIEN